MEFILKKIKNKWVIFSPKGHAITNEFSFKNDDAAISWGYNFISSFVGAKLIVEV